MTKTVAKRPRGGGGLPSICHITETNLFSFTFCSNVMRRNVFSVLPMPEKSLLPRWLSYLMNAAFFSGRKFVNDVLCVVHANGIATKKKKASLRPFYQPSAGLSDWLNDADSSFSVPGSFFSRTSVSAVMSTENRSYQRRARFWRGPTCAGICGVWRVVGIGRYCVVESRDGDRFHI